MMATIAFFESNRGDAMCARNSYGERLSEGARSDAITAAVCANARKSRVGHISLIWEENVNVSGPCNPRGGSPDGVDRFL